MKTRNFLKDSRGSIAISTVILMVVFVGLMGIVIDLGHVFTVQSELRNAADACALRGARAFLPDNIPSTELSEAEPDPDNAKLEAFNTIQVNKSDKVNFQLGDLPMDDIQVGTWDYVARGWLGGNPTWSWPPDSSYWGTHIGPGVTLPTRRTELMSLGPVAMTLAQVFKINAVDVGVKATAALSGIGGFYPGSPTLPCGTWEQMIPDPGEILHGTFRNDTSDTLGWTNLNPADTNPNANELKTIMDQGALYDCPYGSTVGIQNGVASSVIKEMTNPHNRFGLVDSDGDKIYQPSSDINPATDPPVSYADTIYMMPVYSDGSGGTDNFNQSAVVGGIPVKILSVADSRNNYIDVQIVGGAYVSPGYGGGKFYGILSTQPKLVQ
jgi:hypothetical protein